LRITYVNIFSAEKSILELLKIDMKNSFDYLFRDANFPKELEKELENVYLIKKLKREKYF